MTKPMGVSLIVALLLVAGVEAADSAGGGELRPDCNEPAYGTPPCQPCGKMKTCKVIVYDEQERTFYRPVYKEKVEERIIETMEYVEETRYRCQPCTVWQPKPPCGDSCTPVAEACEPADCCAPQKPCEMVPIQILKKVPYTVVVPKHFQKTKKVPRTVVTMEPYTVTVCIPRVEYRQVPVCSAPCCGKPKRCTPGCSEH